jgi:histidine triad (HIT) family protein
MSDCLFCKIVAGEIPSTAVLDTPTVYAFRDIQPSAPVHVLIVPKQHVPGADAIEAEHGALLADLFAAAPRVAEAEGVAQTGYRLIFNVGPDAGQSVFHLHMHLVGGKNLGAVAR